MEIFISQKLVSDLFSDAEAKAPIETCGYLGGTKTEDTIEIRKAYPMQNTDNKTDHFSMNPAEQFKILKKSRDDGFALLAIYHSHPASYARPSQEDITLAYDENILYAIVSLHNRKELKFFSIKNKEVLIVPFVVKENGEF